MAIGMLVKAYLADIFAYREVTGQKNSTGCSIGLTPGGTSASVSLLQRDCSHRAD